jgi:uncharacterized membrane protein YcgQ (UPF0703/DUF1980 family)
MSATRTLLHLISVALLLLWSAVLLYFYATGRIAQYLPGDGIFRPMVLVSGIGLAVLALFNLFTLGAEDPGCEGHGHAHGGDCGHDHAHEGCGHDKHTHGERHDCGHEHAHEGCSNDTAHAHANHDDCGHDHAHACCGHDHAAGAAHSHGHGLLEESSWTGRLVAILILAAPITWAAFMTPDRYSANAVINKGLYNPNYSSTANADKFSLRTDDSNKAAATPSTPAKKPAAPDARPATEQPAVAKAEPQAQSYGSFTLDDLKAQVPQSKDGNFILEVPEIYYTGGDIEVQSVLAGQTVETIAQVLPEKVNNADGRRLRIFRMLVQCCAADARPYSIPVEFADKAPAYKDMTWIKIVGKMAYEKDGDQTVPVLKAEKVEETTEPENTMIY